jgi:catechol 2,3-dioxygenase-like lactoylglutathione lyase family enzyme
MGQPVQPLPDRQPAAPCWDRGRPGRHCTAIGQGSYLPLSDRHTAAGIVKGAFNVIANSHLRIARPTDNIAALLPFYRDGLGFEQIGAFEDHEGFDGVMLGHPSAPYHLEFTHHRGHPAGKAPSQDHLLVFYLPDIEQWAEAVERMTSHGYLPVASFNPYWDQHGLTFEDPDGYRVVLQQAAWRL